jgi:hypothetical protein
LSCCGLKSERSPNPSLGKSQKYLSRASTSSKLQASQHDKANASFMNDNHACLSPALVETIAGLAAGTTSTLAVHPLDVIKTRLQSKPF